MQIFRSPKLVAKYPGIISGLVYPSGVPRFGPPWVAHSTENVEWVLVESLPGPLCTSERTNTSLGFEEIHVEKGESHRTTKMCLNRFYKENLEVGRHLVGRIHVWNESWMIGSGFQLSKVECQDRSHQRHGWWDPSVPSGTIPMQARGSINVLSAAWSPNNKVGLSWCP